MEEWRASTHQFSVLALIYDGSDGSTVEVKLAVSKYWQAMFAEAEGMLARAVLAAPRSNN